MFAGRFETVARAAISECKFNEVLSLQQYNVFFYRRRLSMKNLNAELVQFGQAPIPPTITASTL